MSGLSHAESAALPRDEARAVFGQVMGLVALTLGCLALGAYIGRDLSGGWGILFFIAGFACVFGLNAVIGGVERYQSEGAIAALAERERPAVRTLRGGHERPIPADQLVEGDVIELHAGEVVPADCRLLDADDLEVDESSLTGESLPIPKDPAPSYAAAIADRTSMLYEGTAIAAGRSRRTVTIPTSAAAIPASGTTVS